MGLDTLEPRCLLATLVVSSTGDDVVADNAFTLREAILVANGERDYDTQLSDAERAQITNLPLQTTLQDVITFNFMESGPPIIRPLTGLPSIKQPTLIDGTANLAPGVAIDGGNIPYSPSLDPDIVGYAGLVLGGESVARGLSIYGFQHSRYSTAILIQNGYGSAVEGCHVGIMLDGLTAPAENQNYGVFASYETDDVVIGGDSVSERNIVSGNKVAGLYFNNRADGNIGYAVRGNFIGTDVTGAKAVPNGAGVVARNVEDLTIGGPNPGQGNLISGNTGAGIDLGSWNDTEVSTMIQGNLIGTDTSGLNALPNQIGIRVAQSHTAIGSKDGDAGGNVISGNRGAGVLVEGFQGEGVTVTSEVAIAGNWIGVARDGVTAVPNGGDGVLVGSFTQRVLIGWSGHLEEVAEGHVLSGNVIAHNGGAGVAIERTYQGEEVGFESFAATALSGNVGITSEIGNLDPRLVAVLGNVCFANGGLGIDLGGDGVTPNDPYDADVGPNQLGNFPEFTLAWIEGGALRVSGTVPGSDHGTHIVDLFACALADPSGHGEGDRYLASVLTTVDGAGQVVFQYDVPPCALTGMNVITATATHLDDYVPDPITFMTGSMSPLQVDVQDGGTSEFSETVTIPVDNHAPTLDPSQATFETRGDSLIVPVMSYAHDQDGDPLTLVEWSTCAGGALTPGDGGLIYTPRPDFAGTDTFTYTISDDHGATVKGVVLIRVIRDATPPILTMLERQGVHWQPTRIVLTFSEPLDPSRAADPTCYRIITGAGRDRRYGTPDDTTARLRAVVYQPGTTTVTLLPVCRLPLHQTMRLWLDGTSVNALTDTVGNRLDGDKNGALGGDALIPFVNYGPVPAPVRFRPLRFNRVR